MKRPFIGLWALALSALVSLAAPVYAQTAAVAARPSGPFSYDVSKETTFAGTVSSVVRKPSPGMIIGFHLLIAAPSGTVDASLGRFALLGKGALSVTAGQQVQVTGVMMTLKKQQVFVTRTVKVGDQVYTIRNKHGLAFSPQARGTLSQSAGQQGVQP